MAKKKEKITYIDDGRSLADLSQVSGPHFSRRPKPVRPSAKAVWSTYWGAVKMMLLPMLVFTAGMALVYLILWLIFWAM